MNTLYASNCRVILVALCFLIGGYRSNVMAQDKAAEPVKQEKKWYETIQLRGYLQFRYNRLLETNSKLRCEQCDRSWGENGGFFIRRARLVFSGYIHKNVYFYIQPDLAINASSNSQHYFQIRDAYFDIGFDANNTFKLRLGQSKVPFGFENLQSSQVRLALDRADGINAAVANERDMGAFLYYAPQSVKELFSQLVKDGLKGSGDYGIFAFGLYNGQTANRPELNNKPHWVARVSYPIKLGSQIIEPAAQMYSGSYVMNTDQLSNGVKYYADRSYTDRQTAFSMVLYPQPFGIQAEYHYGRGPRYNPVSDSITVQNVKGGYVLISYKSQISGMTIIPFTRYQFLDGGKKLELDARSHTVRELELGAELQLSKSLEVTAEYVFSSRRFEDHNNRDNLQKGRLLRLQAQINF
jgi:hypothetical protein